MNSKVGIYNIKVRGSVGVVYKDEPFQITLVDCSNVILSPSTNILD